MGAEKWKEANAAASDAAFTLLGCWEAHKRLFKGDIRKTRRYLLDQVDALAQDEQVIDKVNGGGA